MIKKPLFLFFLYLFLEIASFIFVGKWIGFGWAILAIIGCSIAGFLLLKMVGANFMMKALNVAPNKVDVNPASILDPVASILVIIPGFLSTILGFILFLPFVQSWCLDHFKFKIATNSQQFYNTKNNQSSTIEEDIIEGEFENRD